MKNVRARQFLRSLAGHRVAANDARVVSLGQFFISRIGIATEKTLRERLTIEYFLQ